ncbi:MAG: AI-2E family transporter [Candidatus Doudnabacteria bacterium]|nr:AI-2E family transporter [Candidatus Doudnabacteria bacterium]
MNYKRLQMFSFLTILIVALIIALAIFRPFFNVLAFGAIVAILFMPIDQRLEKRFKSPNLAAALTLLLIVAIIVVPLTLFGQLIFNELNDVYHSIREGSLVIDQGKIISSLPSQIQVFIENFTRDLNATLSRFSDNAFQAVSSIITNVTGFILSAVLFLFTVYYLLRDGNKFKDVLVDISPLNERQETELITKIGSAVNGVVKGSFLIALIQGAVAMIGYFIFGVPQPLIWGLLTVMVALVPTVGTALAIVPAIIVLLITDHVGAAIGLAIWGGLAVGLIDNVISPILIGSKTKLHPLLVLFSVIGGISLFGFLGFLLGPIFMAVFVTLVDMFRHEFKDYLD